MPPPANDGEARLSRSRIGDADLQAYAQGALAADDRAAVEGHVPCNPDLAAQAMTSLRLRGRTELVLSRVATRVEALDQALRTSGHLAARQPTAAA